MPLIDDHRRLEPFVVTAESGYAVSSQPKSELRLETDVSVSLDSGERLTYHVESERDEEEYQDRSRQDTVLRQG